MNLEFEVISAQECERLEALHEPLAHAIRRLIDASIRTGADAETILQAQLAIEAVSASLESTETDRPRTLRHAETGRAGGLDQSRCRPAQSGRPGDDRPP